MRKIILAVGTLCVVGAAVVLSQPFSAGPNGFVFQKEERNPVTHFRWNLGADDFQFAIVSDRTGGHRANIFSQTVEKLNLLQPEFVMSVGDLIEGAKKNDQLVEQWKEFDSYASRLSMPFFYVGGNHDLASTEMTKFWADKLGRRHYHFVYKNVLFLVLNADDPPDSKGGIGPEQVAYARKTLEDNAKVRWTLVFLHRPLWTSTAKNGWHDIEKSLEGRPYTVFCGHVHRYQKFVRNGQNYYQLATTGGGSMLRGTEQGEFDHIVWVTMKKDGPILANVMIDAIHTEDLRPIKTNEPGKVAKKEGLNPVRGQVYFDGVPAPGAYVVLEPLKGGAKASGVAAADGSFTLSTYTANDGAVAGEYQAAVTWRQKDAKGKVGPNLLPAHYATGAKSGLRVTIRPGMNEFVLELKK